MTCECERNHIALQIDTFERYVEKKTEKHVIVKRFTWTSERKISVQLITYGATITSIRTPDKYGNVADIVLGYDQLSGYRKPLKAHLGLTVGSVSSLLTKEPSNSEYHRNQNYFQFEKVNWNYGICGKKVTLSCSSQSDDKQECPWNVKIEADFQLIGHEFKIEYRVVAAQETYINIASNTFLNLGGHQSGKKEMIKHFVYINANNYLEKEECGCPTGKILPAEKNPFDFRLTEKLKDMMPAHKPMKTKGFNHSFILNTTESQENILAARVLHPKSARIVEIFSNQPTIHFSTANNFPSKRKCNQRRKKRKRYTSELQYGPYFKYGGFCLKPRNWPNSLGFEPILLNPGETYVNRTSFQFWLHI